MSWAVGYDSTWNRDIGYGVPAYCDHPGCGKEIDRGLAHVCADEQPYGGENGCGLYFCGEHLTHHRKKGFCCERCHAGKKPFAPTPEHPDWITHKLNDESWQLWRTENPTEVVKLRGNDYQLETRECQHCAQFKDLGDGEIPICSKKCMSVARTLCVTYKVIEGTCFEPKG